MVKVEKNEERTLTILFKPTQQITKKCQKNLENRRWKSNDYVHLRNTEIFKTLNSLNYEFMKIIFTRYTHRSHKKCSLEIPFRHGEKSIRAFAFLYILTDLHV